MPRDRSERLVSLVRRARLDSGMTQRQLAHASGISQAAIARIETGRIDPRASTVERLLGAAGRTPAMTSALDPDGIDRSEIRRLLAMTDADRETWFFRTRANLVGFLLGARELE